jgi:hypothetical protein
MAVLANNWLGFVLYGAARKDVVMFKLWRIFFLIFGLLLSDPYVWSMVRLGVPTQGSSRKGDQSESGQDTHGKFKSIFSGNGKALDGTFLEFNSYETPNGTRVGVTRGEFISPAAAQRELLHWLKQASRVIEQRTNKDASGHPIGLRVIGIFPSADRHSENNGILWTDRNKYFWVSSPALELALQVEEDIKSHSLPQKTRSLH